MRELEYYVGLFRSDVMLPGFVDEEVLCPLPPRSGKKKAAAPADDVDSVFNILRDVEREDGGRAAGREVVDDDIDDWFEDDAKRTAREDAAYPWKRKGGGGGDNMPVPGVGARVLGKKGERKGGKEKEKEKEKGKKGEKRGRQQSLEAVVVRDTEKKKASRREERDRRLRTNNIAAAAAAIAQADRARLPLPPSPPPPSPSPSPATAAVPPRATTTDELTRVYYAVFTVLAQRALAAGMKRADRGLLPALLLEEVKAAARLMT